MKNVASYREAISTHAMRCSTTLLVVLMGFATAACSGSSRLPAASTATATPAPVATTLRAQPPLATDPAVLASELSADEQALRDPSSSEAALAAAAHRQQVAYRAIGRHPEWDATVRAAIPPALVETYDRNVDARRQLTALSGGDIKDTLPAWHIDAPAPADALLGFYHEAEAATGVGWNYLAAINLVETGFGRIVGVSTAGAEGPMQFLPSTFATYGDGGDVHSLRDSIMAAGRFLAANGFANDHDHAIFGYNHSGRYVGAVDDYAAVMASDPAGFADFYRWDIYYNTTAGDVLLPVGYAETQRIPVGDYLASHPQ
jgi:membrane-bound lytic murein transglycosylase B